MSMTILEIQTRAIYNTFKLSAKKPNSLSKTWAKTDPCSKTDKPRNLVAGSFFVTCLQAEVFSFALIK